MCGKLAVEIQEQPELAAETPKPPTSPPCHPVGNPHPRGWETETLLGGRTSRRRPGPRAAPSAPTAPASPGPLHPASPVPFSPPASRAGSSPQPEPGRDAGAVDLVSPRAAEDAGAGNGWGKASREAATRHLRVELVVHPPVVATASRSDFRSAGPSASGPATSGGAVCIGT